MYTIGERGLSEKETKGYIEMKVWKVRRCCHSTSRWGLRNELSDYAELAVCSLSEIIVACRTVWITGTGWVKVSFC